MSAVTTDQMPRRAAAGMSIRGYKLLFVLPGLLLLFAIIIFPLLFTIRVSLSGWNVVSPSLDWIGIKNYVGVLSDRRFYDAMLRLGLLSFVTVILQYVLGFGLALLVWRDIYAKRFLRVLFLIPMMTTPVIMAVIWRTIFHESLGPANDLIGLIGMGPVQWLTQSTPATIAVIIVEVWQWTPFMFLLLLAGLISLPREPFLAAAIDGAGPIRTFLNVTFPMLLPVSIGAIIIRLIEASKIVESVYVLTSGGPGTATETAGYYIYIRGLRDFEIGYAAALSITYLIVLTVILTIIAKVLSRFVTPARAGA
jgi:multiple sugar transport system permease protein